MNASRPATNPSQELSRWDFVVLPLLSLFTILVMFAASEVVARIVWPQNEIDSCSMHTNPDVGDRYKANCSSRVKLAEGPWVENRYNDCGYRSSAPCSAKPSGTIRIAIIGSSFAEGFMVPYPETFGAITEKALTQQCQRPVEIQNLGVPSLWPWQLAGRVDEALALHPDVVGIILSPNDLSIESDPDAWTHPQPALQAAVAVPSGPAFHHIFEVIPFLLRQSRSLLMIRHFIYQDAQLYLKIYLNSHGDEADYLRPHYSPNWQKRIDNTETLLGYMAGKVHSAHKPVFLMPGLFYPQVALLNSEKSIAGTDAHAFESKVAAIAANHQITFLPVLDEFAHEPHAEKLFYVANGHMTSPGESIYARALLRQILEQHLLEPFGCTSNTTH